MLPRKGGVQSGNSSPKEVKMGILDHDARGNVMSIAWKPQWRRIAVLAVFAALAIVAMYAGKAQGSPPPSAGKEVPAADRTSGAGRVALYTGRSEEHTSELQS